MAGSQSQVGSQGQVRTCSPCGWRTEATAGFGNTPRHPGLTSGTAASTLGKSEPGRLSAMKGRTWPGGASIRRLGYPERLDLAGAPHSRTKRAEKSPTDNRGEQTDLGKVCLLAKPHGQRVNNSPTFLEAGSPRTQPLWATLDKSPPSLASVSLTVNKVWHGVKTRSSRPKVAGRP